MSLTVKVKETKGGSWLGVCDNVKLSGIPVGVWAGNSQRVTESATWKALAAQFDTQIVFDLEAGVWEDTLNLLPKGE